MHNALLIPEIRSYILDYLVANTGDLLGDIKIFIRTQGAGRRALGVLARTCRSLSEPALDELWYKLDSLEPLLQCSRAKGSDDSGTVNDDEPLNGKLCHATPPRVRELMVSEFGRLSVKILQSLWSGTTLLLPNLWKLHWGPDNFVVIHLLLGPSLRHLDVYLPAAEPTQSSLLEFLESYHTFCPNLKSLEFRYDLQNSSSSEVVAVSHAVRRFPNLEALTCHTLSEDTFLHLAKSCHFKRFSVRLDNHHPDDLRRLAGYSTPDSPLFQNLCVLGLHVKDLSTVIPYLKSRQQPFEDISIEFSDDPSPELFHEFFTALNSPSRRRSLRRIRLQAYKYGRRSRRVAAWQVDFEVLSPLLGFSLHTFDVDLLNSISLNDDELARLVQGWPDLETFRVNAVTGWKSSRFPTPEGSVASTRTMPEVVPSWTAHRREDNPIVD
ncbi:hypothetical protein JVU11DRAFT_390 [Chiua virens]|nr:hypothetical protein JVU11DRAFT_390 [Chiua virens]